MSPLLRVAGFGLIGLLLAGKALDTGGVCIQKMRPLTDKEAVIVTLLGTDGWNMTDREREQPARSSNWKTYLPECCRVVFRGHSPFGLGWLNPYTIEVEVEDRIGKSSPPRYEQLGFELNSCGYSAEEPNRLNISSKEYLEALEANKDFWKKQAPVAASPKPLPDFQ